MSDSRTVLIAKRKNERGKGHNFKGNKSGQDCNIIKQGFKRPHETPKKNLANDRLKRLRTALNNEIRSSPKEQNKPANNASGSNRLNKQNRCDNSARKRSPSVPGQAVPSKVPRSEVVTNKAKYVRKEEPAHENVCAPVITDTLAQKCADANSVEEMEWSTTDEVTGLNASTSTSDLEQTSSGNVNKGSLYKNNFFIVVDTNIFLSQLWLIKEVITMKVTGDQNPVIYIPWIVIEELDFIKDDSNKTGLRFKAQEAIKYIEATLSSKHVRMMGQSLNDVNEQKSVGISQDNKIIACCLQTLEKYKNVVLLTNDINLKNKAHFNNIPVSSYSDIKTKILRVLSQSKAQIVLEKMTSLCTTVICECAKNAYGPASNKMPICQTSPKSIQECISTFTKYWFPVFQEVLMKQFKKSIDDLSSFLSKNTVVKDDTNQLSELVRLCVRMCLFLKDVQVCKDTIENTIRELNRIKES